MILIGANVVRNQFPEGDDRITKGNLNGKKYAEYISAIQLCNQLDENKIIGEFEDPDQGLIWHGGIIKIPDGTDLDENEIKIFSEMLGRFDGLSVFVDTDGAELSVVKHCYERET